MATVELRAERMVAGGDALAREPGGRVVFVTGALPGERVLVRMTDEKADFGRAVVAEVLEPSASRRSPPCPFVAAGCGGCGWQHVDPIAQVELKVAIVRESLVRTGRLREPVVVAGPPLDPFGFRTTLRLGVDERGQAGFRARRSHDLVPVDACLVAHPSLDELLSGHRLNGATAVTLRCGARTGERLAIVEPRAAERLVSWPDDVAVGPKARYHEVVDGRRLRISARSFFQTRADGADVLVELVRDAAGNALGEGRLVDAYAGVGLFAATLGAGGEVVAIEASASACADARANLAGLDARVVHADVARWRPVPASTVIADPARAGLGKQAIAALAATGAARLVLVSCDAVALARDASLLSARGYDHAQSVVVDLFPHTAQVEVVTRFERR
jgi:23S rRNA (uracil1939-C5)-methyltransferase